MSLRKYVPDDKKYWYFHEESGIVLRNDGEWGWLIASPESARDTYEELQDTIESMEENDVFKWGDEKLPAKELKKYDYATTD